MLNNFKYISIISVLLACVLIGIAILRFKKMLKLHRKASNDDFLSESEKIIQNKSIIILIIGVSIIIISILMQGILIFIIHK